MPVEALEKGATLVSCAIIWDTVAKNPDVCVLRGVEACCFHYFVKPPVLITVNGFDYSGESRENVT